MTRTQSQHLKKAFLAEFAARGNISAACRAIGVDRGSYYSWLEKDEQFALAARRAELESTERLEAEAYRRAHDGVTHATPILHHGEVVSTVVETKYSDTLLIFLLKARNPAKYRDNVTLTLQDKRQAEKLAEKLAAELALPLEDVLAELATILKARA